MPSANEVPYKTPSWLGGLVEKPVSFYSDAENQAYQNHMVSKASNRPVQIQQAAQNKKPTYLGGPAQSPVIGLGNNQIDRSINRGISNTAKANSRTERELSKYGL